MPTQAPLHSSAALGVLYAIGAATVFSTAGLIVRRIGLPAWDVSFWRSILLIATISPLLVLHRQRVWIDVRSGGIALFFSALALAGSFVFFILALDMAPVANVVMMFGAIPFMTAALARLFLGEPMHRHTVIAMIVAIGGLAISVGGSLKVEALAGMALASLVSLCMSINYVIVRHRRDIGMAPSLVLAGILSGIVAAPFAHPQNTDFRQFGWLLALGPGQLAGGLLLYIAALKRIPAGPAALLGLLEPVLGPVWVWAIDGEKPDSLTLLGGAVVIAAAAANVWLDSRRSTG
jgi:drug/metabolite transporter (DMT)-like permease